MRSVNIFFSRLIYIFLLLASACTNKNNPNLKDLSFLELPSGFQIDFYAQDVENVRAMCKGPEGVLFAGSRGAGNVYAIIDSNNDFKADQIITLVDGLNMPVGVAYKNGDLYFSEVGKIWRIKDVIAQLNENIEPELYTSIYPDEESHGWKFIDFSPSGELYVPVGSPCNNCLREDSIFASITRYNESNNSAEIVAHGVRNTVGFDWHPLTGELWFTDNGRDWLGDNSPPCELNRLQEKGSHYGYPFCHGENVSDPEFGEISECENFTAPVEELGPHVAPLGMTFYKGDQFPPAYKHHVFIAEHGSWNRSTKIGYRISMVRLDENFNSLGYDIFIEGWEKNGEVFGRPVDVLELNDGSLLISDDYANAIYRVTYGQ